ncbi:phosphofructokinase [Cellulomonas sp. APG4]|uniref:1-phosphofructokinase family hexose kinase n=1 Tax=Cellulomonas sp. APG4 TaxID=1538656 RepID=UPI001379FBC7|nr:phosphofructokinase [Cellulomonas sp. APG4]
MTRARPENATHDDGAAEVPTVCVLAVTPQLTVTIEPPVEVPSEDDVPGADEPEDEPSRSDDEIHVHVGGQGLWVARMAESLGAQVTVCAPFGGETGELVAHLAGREGFDLRSIGVAGATGAYVHDRRPGERTELARMATRAFGRHELDDLYGSVLVAALDADVTVITGAEPPSVVPPDLFGRLATDLRAQGRTVVADLSGDAARAVAEAGLTVLKMSHEEMLETGIARGAGVAALRRGAERLLGPVDAVVVSRAEDPTLVVTADRALLVRAPAVTTVDHRGAGDSLTAGTAVGLARGLDVAEAVRLGTAAGALNVTRRGLGSGRPEQVERLAAEVELEHLD